MVVASERCWECGDLVPEGEVCRRDVRVAGTSHSSWTQLLEAPRHTDGSVTSRVSLCPACAADADRQQRIIVGFVCVLFGLALLGAALLAALLVGLYLLGKL